MFSQKQSLRAHFRDYHGENAGKTFKCEECEKEFTAARSLKKHKSVVHGKREKKAPQVQRVLVVDDEVT